tara:strand:+ start:20315 stop:20641 length:327 start_codon:yes stop_codon:yes gene_type:complete
MKFNPRVALCFAFGFMVTLVGVSFLVSCSEQPQQPKLDVPLNATQEQTQQTNSSGGGMLEHMAGAAVAGAAAGTAGAVAHRATNHIINKHQERKARRQARPRTYRARR